jgi:HSP20 family protein
MVETATKLPIKTEGKPGAKQAVSWHPVEDLRHEVDRLFEEFGRYSLLRPFHPINLGSAFHQAPWANPAVDVTENDKAFEITAELPGLEPKDVEIVMRNGNLVIKGEKHEQNEEKTADYHLQERRFGSFERSFALPNGIDSAKIESRLKNGVLTVSLPKAAEAVKPQKKIEIKAA